MRQLLTLALLLPCILFAQTEDYPFASYDNFKFYNFQEFAQAIGYPKEARDASLEGMVACQILFDSNGNYLSHKILKCPHPILKAAVEAHISCLRKEPMLGPDGKATPHWVIVPVNFQLRP